MSRIHVEFQYRISKDELLEYVVLSPDFNDQFELEEVGILTIDKARLDYIFKPTGRWAGRDIIPPHVYSLSDEDRLRVIAAEFSQAECGGWTLRIDRMAKKLLAELSP